MATSLTDDASTRRPFTIPTTEELDEIDGALFSSATPVEELYLALLHATGGVDKPLHKLATTPTLEDIGALYVFAAGIRHTARMLSKHVDAIQGMLENLDGLRRPS